MLQRLNMAHNGVMEHVVGEDDDSKDRMGHGPLSASLGEFGAPPPVIKDVHHSAPDSCVVLSREC